MYAKVLLCLALPVVANSMGVIVDDRKTCQGPDGSSATATKFTNVGTKDDCISFCQSESAAYGDNCRRTIVWQDDCGGDTACLSNFPGSDNCYCNYQVACGCTCYYCPVPDWMQDIDGPNAPYPVPDWNAVGPCGGQTC